MRQTPPFKVAIVNLDQGEKEAISAQYNPKELGVDKSVSWTAKPVGKKGDAPKEVPDVEFTSGTGRSLSLELFFDGFEEKEDVHKKYVDPLLELTKASVEDKAGGGKHPPLVALVWGTGNKLPKFKGVIESVSTKYTMFLNDGTPCRATCTVKLKEADSASFKKGGGGAGGGT
jgi:Contractile injection system tube protein